jgi:hypothetical protein
MGYHDVHTWMDIFHTYKIRMPDHRTRKVGSRRMVWNGSAEQTAGGLRKEHLMRNKYGRIVSTRRHSRMKAKHGGATTEPAAPHPSS